MDDEFFYIGFKKKIRGGGGLHGPGKFVEEKSVG